MFATPTSTTNRLRPNRHRRGRLAPLLVGTALLFAACGSGAEAADESGVAALPESTESTDATENETNEDSSGETAELSAEEAQLAFSQCLEDQGIDDPFGGGTDGETIAGGDESDGQTAALTFDSEEDFEAFDQAQKECSELLGDAFGEFEATPEQEALMADAELKFNQCMSDQGFEMSEGGIQIEDGDFEKMEAAASECDSAFDELNDSFGAEGEDN